MVAFRAPKLTDETVTGWPRPKCFGGGPPPAPRLQRHERRVLDHHDISGLGHSTGEGQVFHAGGLVPDRAVVDRSF